MTVCTHSHQKHGQKCPPGLRKQCSLIIASKPTCEALKFKILSEGLRPKLHYLLLNFTGSSLKLSMPMLHPGVTNIQGRSVVRPKSHGGKHTAARGVRGGDNCCISWTASSKRLGSCL